MNESVVGGVELGEAELTEVDIPQAVGNLPQADEATGRPDNTGWLETDSGQLWIRNDTTPDWTGLNREQKYKLRQNDPRNYDTPRQIRFGMRVHF